MIVALACAGCGTALAQVDGFAPVRRSEVGVYLIEISDLDERAGTLTAEFDVVTRWQDPARAWTVPADASDRRLFLNEDAIAELRKGWWPALHAVNGVGGYDRGLLYLAIRADGTVINRARLRLTLRATLDFRHFPFDHQELPVAVESVLEPAARMSLAAAEDFAGFAEDFTMPEWRLDGMTIEHGVVERIQENQPYERVTFRIGITRLTGYYVWKIMLPMVIIVMISWIVFWMSDEGLGRRAGVSSTGMLTVIAYQFVVSASLPRFPYLTVMDRFALASLVFIAATMLVNLMGSRCTPESRLRLDRVCRGAFPLAYIVVAGLVLKT